MGQLTMQLMLVGGVGWITYHMLWALGRRAVAKLLQLSCYCIALAIALQMVAAIGAWAAGTPVYKLIEKLGG